MKFFRPSFSSQLRSKNFDGSQFHNQSAIQMKSLWSFIKTRSSHSWAQWPKWIDSDFGHINSAHITGSEIRINHINHATVLIQMAGLNILTDPIFSERCSPFSWIGPKRVREPGIRFGDLPAIDIVLLSHDHYDHLDIPTVERLMMQDSPAFYMGLGVADCIKLPIKATEMDWWESVKIKNNIELHFVPVQHFSGRGLFHRNSTLWGGFVIKTPERSVYFGGDTGYGKHFAETREKLVL